MVTYTRPPHFPLPVAVQDVKRGLAPPARTDLRVLLDPLHDLPHVRIVETLQGQPTDGDVDRKVRVRQPEAPRDLVVLESEVLDVTLEISDHSPVRGSDQVIGDPVAEG